MQFELNNSNQIIKNEKKEKKIFEVSTKFNYFLELSSKIFMIHLFYFYVPPILFPF